MKKITCMLLLIQGGFMMAQTKTLVTVYGEKVQINPNSINIADNGLSASNGNVQLGGDLLKPSTITTTPVNTLSIGGLQTGTNTDNVLVADTNGVLKWVTRASFVSPGDNLGDHKAIQALDMAKNPINNIFAANFPDQNTENANSYSIYKKNGNFGIFNSLKNSDDLYINEPTRRTTVNNLAISNSTNGLAPQAGYVATAADAQGNVEWRPNSLSLDIIPNDVGSVMAIDGKLEIAQEITVLMKASTNYNFPASTSTTPLAIGNLTNVIIDNKNLYTSSASTNSFKVTADGTYQIMMNMCINTVAGSFPVLGIWDDTGNRWVARVNDEYYATTTQNGVKIQTYTLITAIPLAKDKAYSFRVLNTSAGSVVASSSGTSGTGPISYASVKRLR